MKIHYWGTAAAEGIPSVFCDCDVCREAREKGGRLVRTRSQVMIDDELLVDFGADTYAHALMRGANLARLEHVLITHTHEDHFYPQELHNRQIDFAYKMKAETLILHGADNLPSDYALFMGAEHGEYLLKQNRVGFDILQPYERKRIGNFYVTPLPATHGTARPFIYIIERDGKTMLYFNDSGFLREPVFEWLKNSTVKLDLVSYDCTAGTRDTLRDWGKEGTHMGLPTVVLTRERLREAGVYRDTTVDIVTHFSHNGLDVGYNEFKPLAEREGFIVAYDGYQIEI